MPLAVSDRLRDIFYSLPSRLGLHVGMLSQFVPAVRQLLHQLRMLTGKVISVTDGDTLTLLVGKTQIKVRLEGIDAPDRGQPFGTKARQALSEEVFGKTVQMEDLGKDRYKRTLGVVRVGDRHVNLELVREGWAR